MIQSYVADNRLLLLSSVSLPRCATYLKLTVEPFFRTSVFSSLLGIRFIQCGGHHSKNSRLIVSLSFGYVDLATKPLHPGYSLHSFKAFMHVAAVFPLPNPPPQNCTLAYELWNCSCIPPSTILYRRLMWSPLATQHSTTHEANIALGIYDHSVRDRVLDDYLYA